MTPYERLKSRFFNINNLRNVIKILDRDMITVLPSGASQDRTNQIVSISEQIHANMTAPEMGDDIEQAYRQKTNLPKKDQINLELMKRSYDRTACLSDEIVSERARLANVGKQNHTVWRAARDWDKMRSHLEQTVSLNREIAAARHEALQTDEPYDTLIDDYDPYGSGKYIKSIFDPVEDFLKRALPEAIEKSKNKMPPKEIPGPFHQESHEALHEHICRDLGFDFDRGVMYMVDQHPSCYGSPDDVRFTTRAYEHEYKEALRATIHEVGHGLYEQNLDPDYRYQPVGDAVGMTIHESQALFWEKQIGNHPNFFKYLSPLLSQYFNMPAHDESLSPENLAADGGMVAPGYIRIEADEMTYPMHIFLRFDLERKLIAGTLDVKDLPEAWSEGMKDRLGIVPPDHSLGCMQDIHWPMGAFGYFPSYSLGAIVAAQLAAKMRHEIDSFDDNVAAGDFAPILRWLIENVHVKGSSLTPMGLVKEATGEELTPDYYINHLKRRYIH